MGLFLGDEAHADHTAIGQVDDIDIAALRGGGDGHLEHDFVHVGAHRLGADVELDVDLRRLGPLEHVRRVGVLDREILHILRQQADRRLGVGAVGLGIAARCIVEIGEHAFFVGHWSGVFQIG